MKKVTFAPFDGYVFGDIATLNFYDQDLIIDVLNSDNVVKHCAIVVQETFIEKEYAKYPVKECIVVDVGAFYGDTAIYFLREGALKVYCFEPYISAMFINKNVMINRFKVKQVEVNNSPVLGTAHEVKYHHFGINDGALKWREEGEGEADKSITLDDIVTKIISERGDNTETSNMVLKMDCEGAEHEIFEKVDRNKLRKFKYIMLEVHDGRYDDVKANLEKFGYVIDDVHEEFIDTFMLYAHREGN